MDLRRLRPWDWVAGSAGAVLIGSTFVDWYSVKLPRLPHTVARTTVNAWQAFTVVDVILLIAGLVGLAIPIVVAVQRTAAIPQAFASLSFLPVLLAAVLVLVKLLDPPSAESIAGNVLVLFGSAGAISVARDAGAWVALAASLLLVVASWRAMNDTRLLRAPRPEVEVLPAPDAG